MTKVGSTTYFQYFEPPITRIGSCVELLHKRALFIALSVFIAQGLQVFMDSDCAGMTYP